MAEDKTADYVTTLEARNKVRGQLVGMAKFLGSVASGLSTANLRIANSDLSVPLGVSDANIVDYSQWPEKEKVKQAMQEFYRLDTEAKNKYNALEESVRKYVSAPDDDQIGGRQRP